VNNNWYEVQVLNTAGPKLDPLPRIAAGWVNKKFLKFDEVVIPPQAPQGRKSVATS